MGVSNKELRSDIYDVGNWPESSPALGTRQWMQFFQSSEQADVGGTIVDKPGVNVLTVSGDIVNLRYNEFMLNVAVEQVLVMVAPH